MCSLSAYSEDLAVNFYRFRIVREDMDVKLRCAHLYKLQRPPRFKPLPLIFLSFFLRQVSCFLQSLPETSPAYLVFITVIEPNNTRIYPT